MFGTRKLGRTSDQRKAMLRAMTTYLLENGKMETTFTRAKEVQPVVEKMITLGKKKGLANYRKALAYITKEDVAHKLFEEIAPKYAERSGGYTVRTILIFANCSGVPAGSSVNGSILVLANFTGVQTKPSINGAVLIFANGV